MTHTEKIRVRLRRRLCYESILSFADRTMVSRPTIRAFLAGDVVRSDTLDAIVHGLGNTKGARLRPAKTLKRMLKQYSEAGELKEKQPRHVG